MINKSFLKLDPHMVFKIWGGEKLLPFKAVDEVPEGEQLGETWEISCLREGSSMANGEPLSGLITCEHMPYLVKLIDTSDNLSVQVHPGDDYAAKHENSKGKTESWLILDSDDGAGIYLGLKHGVTKDQFHSALASGAEMNELLNFIPVKRGDFFFVPAGSIHAIGKGVTLAEVQQSSGITYRVWDWNRVDKNGVGRELHVSKSLDVIEFSAEKNAIEFFNYQNISDQAYCEVTSHSDFAFDSYRGRHEIDFIKRDRGFYHSFLVLEGTVAFKTSHETVELGKYQAGMIVNKEDILGVSSSEDALFLHIF